MNVRSANIETDLPGIVGLINACEPEDPTTIDEMRAEFLRTGPGRIARRLVAVAGEALVGYLYLVHSIEMPAHHFYIWMRVDPQRRGQGIGSALWEAALEFLRSQGATRLMSEARDSDPASLAFAQRRGFAIERQHFYSFLDLNVFDEAPYLPGIAALEAEGLRFCTLADFPDSPETRRKFFDLNLAVVRDIPGEDWDFEQYADFFEKRILGSPRFRREGQILAVDGDTWAGFATLNLYPEEHSAYNATTGVIRPYRGRKIALALKVLAARYARQHGAQTVRTDNDSLNAPILAINRKMGYQPQPGTYWLVCWLAEETNGPQV